MVVERSIHPDFQFHLDFKSRELAALYKDLRDFILQLCPDATEMLYHTHALTSLYSVSAKMSDGFCMIPIYTDHLNLGFNKGTLLHDPRNILTGTGKLIRHIPVRQEKDYNNKHVKELVLRAHAFAIQDSDNQPAGGLIISKIKK